ncbi:unnamed protein product, partial [marine sediment metagenome]
MKVAKGTAQAKGIGKPDYAQEVSSARVRPGLRLEYKEVQRAGAIACFTGGSLVPACWCREPLEAGGTAYAIDMEEGFTDTPVP